MGFSRQESWSGLPCPPPRNLPDAGIEPESLTTAASACEAFTLMPPGKSHWGPSVQFSSIAQSCPTLCNPMDCSTSGFPVRHQLLELAQTHVHRVDDALQPSHFPSSASPPSFNLSRHQGFYLTSQLFTSGGQRFRVSASASVLPMNIQDSFPLGWSGLISLQSKGLSRVLQHHSSKASVLQLSAFFTVQLSHPYMTCGKTIALTRWTFVGKVMALLFNMLSRLVIPFLPRSRCLLISSL